MTFGRSVNEIKLEKPNGELYKLIEEIELSVDAVRRGVTSVATGENGIRAVALCDAAQWSINENREVSISIRCPTD